MTRNLVISRTGVMKRMIEEARKRGGNAIAAMRYDTCEMGDGWTEICAYGTAVAAPLTDDAREVARQLGYAGGAATQR